MTAHVTPVRITAWPCKGYVLLLRTAIFLLICSSSRAQQNPSQAAGASTADLVALRDAAIQDDYLYRLAAHLCDNIGPRPVGSPQAQAAIQYIASELKNLGLDVRLEPVRARQWVRGSDSAELVEYPQQPLGAVQKIIVTALGGNFPTPPQGLTADVVVVRNFEELTSLSRDAVSGKIVLFDVLFDKRKAAANFGLQAYVDVLRYRREGAKRAAALGAAAALIRSAGSADYRLAHAGSSTPAGIPTGAVAAEDADLIAHLAQQGRVRLHLTLLSQLAGDITTYNVVADLKGSEHPEQVVIVSGHLDSWDLGTGALDDAAGVAIAVETAKLMEQLHLHPKRTLRIVAWIDEENLASGSTAYMRQHASEITNHVAAIESDYGATHPLGIYTTLPSAGLSFLEPVKAALQPLGADQIIASDNLPVSDIDPLIHSGVAGFAPIEDGRTYFDYHHSAADTLDKIVPRELRENAAVVSVLSYWLTGMPEAQKPKAQANFAPERIVDTNDSLTGKECPCHDGIRRRHVVNTHDAVQQHRMAGRVVIGNCLNDGVHPIGL